MKSFCEIVEIESLLSGANKKTTAARKVFRKHYADAGQAMHERLFYNKKPDFSPALIASFISEKTIYNDFEHVESRNLWQQKSVDFASIGRLYAQLHDFADKDQMVICHMDTNPQNIIWSVHQDRYFLVDFGDWLWFYGEYDLIHFLLFWASAKCAGEFDLIADAYLKGYHAQRKINVHKWDSLYAETINNFDKRRANYNKKESVTNLDVKCNRDKLKNVSSYLF